VWKGTTEELEDDHEGSDWFARLSCGGSPSCWAPLPPTPRVQCACQGSYAPPSNWSGSTLVARSANMWSSVDGTFTAAPAFPFPRSTTNKPAFSPPADNPAFTSMGSAVLGARLVWLAHSLTPSAPDHSQQAASITFTRT